MFIERDITEKLQALMADERILLLKEEEIWKEGDSLTGLPKVSHRKAVVRKKDSKVEGEEGEEGTEATTEAAASEN